MRHRSPDTFKGKFEQHVPTYVGVAYCQFCNSPLSIEGLQITRYTKQCKHINVLEPTTSAGEFDVVPVVQGCGLFHTLPMILNDFPCGNQGCVSWGISREFHRFVCFHLRAKNAVGTYIISYLLHAL